MRDTADGTDAPAASLLAGEEDIDPLSATLAAMLRIGIAFAARAPPSYGDEKVANRDIRVWHGAIEKGP
jgi:hypothetical protein